MINVTINSETHQFDTEQTIEELLKELEITKNGTAIAVNNRVIPRSKHGEFRVTDGDVLEIIRAVGGG